MSFQRFDSGSAANGELAKGCQYCINGSKMVLLVTGRCRAGCFYCPVSAEKKGRDVTYANEGRVHSDEDVINEALAMDAEGTGITGGDPSEMMDRTIHYIELLKNRFGKGHHIHMYTSVISLENARRLEAAGLDEIRYHPIESLWDRMDSTELRSIIENTGMDVGIEVPALPGKEKELECLVEYAFEAGIDFMNLNELEFSESNWDMMATHNFLVKDELSSAVLGAEECAIHILNKYPDYRIHFCSSTFKDSVQLRNRLTRRAEHIAKEYDVITDDGTLVKGIIYHRNLDEALTYLKENYDVPDELMYLDSGRNRIEIAPWILEEVGAELPFKCYIVEEYPTEDRLEVERTPIN
ncbi:MAG: radical SAM protein [archaeon]|nr:radical SAM protein [archaeon]